MTHICNIMCFLYIHTIFLHRTSLGNTSEVPKTEDTNTTNSTSHNETIMTTTSTETMTITTTTSQPNSTSTESPTESSGLCSSHSFIVFIVQRSNAKQEDPGKYKKIATGVLISWNWVMTAKSRTDFIDPYFMEREVFAGSSLEVDLVKGEIRKVDKVHKHEGQSNDLALIKLRSPFDKKNSKIAPVSTWGFGFFIVRGANLSNFKAKLPPKQKFWKSCTSGRCLGFNIFSSLDRHLLCQHLTFCEDEEMSREYACVRMDSNDVDNLLSTAGSAVICQTDIFVGMVAMEVDEPDKQVTSIGEYMTWIHETTGIPVNYSSKPPTAKGTPLLGTDHWFILSCQLAFLVLLAIQLI